MVNTLKARNYLSITYFPPKDKENKLKSLFVTTISEDHTEEILEKYNDELTNVISLLKTHFLEFEELTVDETVTFLHSCFTGEHSKKINI